MCWWSPTPAPTAPRGGARACGARVIGIGARNVGAARAAGMTELLRLTAGLTRPRSGWRPPTPTPWCRPAGCGASSSTRTRAGMSCSARSPSRTGASIRRTCRPRSRPGTLRRRAAPARTRREPRHPGLGLPGGGRFRPLRTAEDHALLAAATKARLLGPAGRDITVETSARRHARARTASVTCCEPWPHRRTRSRGRDPARSASADAHQRVDVIAWQGSLDCGR